MLKNLKLLRNEVKISQQQLANVIGVSQQSVNKYENHSVEPDINTLIKIADYFSVSVDYLIGRTATRTVPNNYTKYDLTDEEMHFIDRYRNLSQREKIIIKLILD